MKTNLKLLLLLVLSTAASHQAKTQNAKDWKAITVPMQQVDNLYFWHADSGFALDKTSNALYKTTDGGNTWKVLYEFRGFTWTNSTKLIQFIDKNTIYYTYRRFDTILQDFSHKWFYRTYDGGQTWEEKVDVNPMVQPWDDYCTGINFYSKDEGFLYFPSPGSNNTYKMFTTADAGLTLKSFAQGLFTPYYYMNGLIIKMAIRQVPPNNEKEWFAFIYNGWDSMLLNVSRTASKKYESTPPTYDYYPVDEHWWNRVRLDYTKDGCNTFDSLTPNYFDAYTAGKKQRDPGFGNEIMQVRQLDINYYLVDLKRWYLENTGFGLSNKCHAIIDSNTAIIGTSTNIILKTSNRGGLDSTRKALSTGMQQQARQEKMKVKVYPNPASSQLSIEVLNAQGFEISLTNLEGKTVKAGNVTAASITLNTADLARGMYLLRVISPTGGLSVHKVLLR